MNQQDRDAIEGIFARLQSLEAQGGPRDAEAEAYIRERLQAQPGAAYYLAQTVVVQEQALRAAQQRIDEQAATAGHSPAAPAQRPGALANAGFGRSVAGQPASGSAVPAMPAAQAAGRGAGGGFLAGALQTAMGVAGGLMLGNLLGGLFGAGDAQAAETEASPEQAGAQDASHDDAGGFDDIGGGFDDI